MAFRRGYLAERVDASAVLICALSVRPTDNLGVTSFVRIVRRERFSRTPEATEGRAEIPPPADRAGDVTDAERDGLVLRVSP